MSKDRLAEIFALPEKELDHQLGLYIAGRKAKRNKNLKVILRYYPEITRRGLEGEAYSEVLLAETEYIMALKKNPEKLKSIRNLEAMIFMQTKTALKAFVEKATTPASGMVSTYRRALIIKDVLADLAKQGTPLDKDQVLSLARARQLASRKDKSRIGQAVSWDDLIAFSEASGELPEKTTGKRKEKIDFTPALAFLEDSLIEFAAALIATQKIITKERLDFPRLCKKIGADQTVTEKILRAVLG
ncbi:hypothetical protein [uncultured Varibaculum sp.]|uniref:hypothetical protein n=1 Tax=uncultured Varibaculum sp. TaxID=413896 RepID=UPI00288A691D|nr:hypothetical protein [uncultured Varibaculum sp.]